MEQEILVVRNTWKHTMITLWEFVLDYYNYILCQKNPIIIVGLKLNYLKWYFFDLTLVLFSIEFYLIYIGDNESGYLYLIIITDNQYWHMAPDNRVPILKLPVSRINDLDLWFMYRETRTLSNLVFWTTIFLDCKI